jgi:hypothetical protein
MKTKQIFINAGTIRKIPVAFGNQDIAENFTYTIHPDDKQKIIDQFVKKGWRLRKGFLDFADLVRDVANDLGLNGDALKDMLIADDPDPDLDRVIDIINQKFIKVQLHDKATGLHIADFFVQVKK